MSNGENEGNILKTLAIIILVITAITLVFLFIHDRTVGEAGDSSNVSQTSESVSAANTGACIIGPKRVENGVVRLGEGVNNSESVCDAATQGCGTCWDQCAPYVKIIDNYGCTEDYSTDGWCNPNAPVGADLDCIPPEDCGNGIDDDQDGRIDCKDYDCAGSIECDSNGVCDFSIENKYHPDCSSEGMCPCFDQKRVDELISWVEGPWDISPQCRNNRYDDGFGGQFMLRPNWEYCTFQALEYPNQPIGAFMIQEGRSDDPITPEQAQACSNLIQDSCPTL